MVEENRKVTVDAYENYDNELEDQFILRLPPAPAAALRDAIRSDVSNLEDRLQIQTDPDMRHATVQFDKLTLPAKLLDLPTIIESCKTLDGKVFYKTADICQIMIAEERDASKNDEEVPAKKKDKNAKDKRYMYPHGITPPLKNVRKKRFRKTLEKKYVDWHNIENEVKRLFRADADAISFRYEVCNTDAEKAELKTNEEEGQPLIKIEFSNSQTADFAKYDLFGEILSSSEESGEECDVKVVDAIEREAAQKLQSIKEKQEKVQECCNMKDAKAVAELSNSRQLAFVTAEQLPDPEGNDNTVVSQLESATAVGNLDLISKEQKAEEEKIVLMEKLHELENTISNLQAKRRTREMEITNIENQALKRRFQANIDHLIQEECEKQQEYNNIVNILQEN